MCDHCMNRREFTTLSTAGLVGGVFGLSSMLAAERAGVEPWDPDRPPVVTGRTLRVQPILAHNVMAPQEKTSWRSWSDIINEPAAAEEMQRIAGELKDLKARSEPISSRTSGRPPKIEMPIGQHVCAISPEYTKPRWVGIKGIVRDNPSLAICRSQQDVEIVGQWKRLIPEARDSHWMMVYGDYLREIGYAVRKIGMTWDNVSDT